MKKVMLISILVLTLAAGYTMWLTRHPQKWIGLDDTIEKLADDAGHPARKPFINTDQGDLLLFFFLIAGAVGGFTAGYCFRELFPPEEKR